MRRVALAVLVAALAAGCLGGKAPIIGEPAPQLKDSAAEAAYQVTLEKYTSHRQIYTRLDPRIFSAMTSQTPAFVEARVRRSGAFLQLPAADIDVQVQKELADTEPFYDFILGVHLNNYRYDDFDKKNSTWRLALVTATGDVTPAKIERVGRSNLNLRALYPYLDDFWVAYRVRFPKTAENGQPTQEPGATKRVVRMASTLGQTEFEFPAQ
jgi:hypothetical protein